MTYFPESLTVSPPPECFTCAALRGKRNLPGGLVWRDPLVVVNHHVDEYPEKQHSSSRAGWIIVSPIRHVERVFDINEEEWNRLGRVICLVDRALTEIYDSRRTLVASLGWFTRDHVHFHCVPTFGEEVSLGSWNFDGAYEPLAFPSAEVAVSVREFLNKKIQVGRQ